MKHLWKWTLGALSVAAVFGTSGVNYNPTVPGAINPDVTQANIQETICVSGWTATIRPPASYTTKLKAQQLPPHSILANFEEDHAISLELGGNPISPQNLWPQPYPQAHQKDQVENYLKKAVCSGQMTLADAQKQVLNWYPVYQKLSHAFGATSVDASDTDD